MAALCNNRRTHPIPFPKSTFNLFSHFFLFLFHLRFATAVSFNYSNLEITNTVKPNISFEGDASPASWSIELTLKIKHSVGRATFAQPVSLWNSTTRTLTDFTTHFTFLIDSPDPMRFGDGLAFFLAPFSAKLPSNSDGGFLGLPGNSTWNTSPENPYVAVEFDTFQNTWDPDSHHVGINVNSIQSVMTIDWNVMNVGKLCNVWISYNASLKNLSVFFTHEKEPVFMGNSSLSYIVDLMEVLPECIRVGFSGATGYSIEQNSILSWDFNSSLDENQCRVEEILVGRRKKMKTRVIAWVMFPVFLAVLLSGIGFWWRKISIIGRKKEGKEMMFDESMEVAFDRGTAPTMFSYNKLALATKNFWEGGKVGEGGSGKVYRGFLSDITQTVAVKKISRGSTQGKKEFTSEVKIISQLRHRNLVQLIGWSHDRGELLLVYEFMPNGSLDLHLFGKRRSLTWELRYKIALGLASALAYLHEEWEQCVVHRDVKSSNVMLDSGFNAKLGDFGLARLIDHKLGLQTTALAGTIGYMAPECFMGGKASKESDVFSYGVVALEIACGRKAVDPEVEESKVRLVDWAWEVYGAGRVFDAVDRSLDMNFDEKEMECLMTVGLWCAHPDHNLRPSIRQAIQVLNFEAPLPSLPSKMPVPIYSLQPVM